MNKEAPLPEVKRKKTVKDELRDFADENCSKCHGRGHTGYNATTNKYAACRCVRKKLRKGKTTETEILANEILVAAERARQSSIHLERLNEEIARKEEEWAKLQQRAEAANQMSEEEASARAEMAAVDSDLEAAMASSAQDAADAAALDDEVEELKKLLKEKSRKALELHERSDKTQRSAQTLAAQEKRRISKTLNALATAREAAHRKAKKKSREAEAKIEKLRRRAGTVQEEIDRATQLVAKHTT